MARPRPICPPEESGLQQQPVGTLHAEPFAMSAILSLFSTFEGQCGLIGKNKCLPLNAAIPESNAKCYVLVPVFLVSSATTLPVEGTCPLFQTKTPATSIQPPKRMYRIIKSAVCAQY
mmetsp:Transcript_114271/g.198682  ORF Transcript_114271/g.198682 Transcript_114271/m.198682 type:complete len:118 (-) Transcript_114271:677-1030(-)